MGKPGVILGGIHVEQAVKDSRFFQLMPEFSGIRAQLAAMHSDLSSKRGCSACNKRRMHNNIDSNFVAIASRLPKERAAVLKQYLGIGDDRLLYIRYVEPTTRQVKRASI